MADGPSRSHTDRLSYDEAFELYTRANMPTPPNAEKLVQSAMNQAFDGIADEEFDTERIFASSPPWSAAAKQGTGSLGTPRRGVKGDGFSRRQLSSPRTASVFKRVGRFTLDPA